MLEKLTTTISGTKCVFRDALYIIFVCHCYYQCLPTKVSMVGGKAQLEKITKSLVPNIYPIQACLKVLITYGKVSEQKTVRRVESVTGLLSLSIDILN